MFPNGEHITLNASDSRSTWRYHDLLCEKFEQLFFRFPYAGDCNPSGSSYHLLIELYLQMGMARDDNPCNDIRDEDLQSRLQNFVSDLDAHLGTSASRQNTAKLLNENRQTEFCLHSLPTYPRSSASNLALHLHTTSKPSRDGVTNNTAIEDGLYHWRCATSYVCAALMLDNSVSNLLHRAHCATACGKCYGLLRVSLLDASVSGPSDAVVSRGFVQPEFQPHVKRNHTFRVWALDVIRHLERRGSIDIYPHLY